MFCSYEAVRPPVIPEVTEEEEDEEEDMPPPPPPISEDLQAFLSHDNQPQNYLTHVKLSPNNQTCDNFVQNRDIQEFSTPSNNLDDLQNYLTPVKNSEQSILNVSRGAVLSDRKIRNVTQV